MRAQSRTAREVILAERGGHKWSRLSGGITCWAGTLAPIEYRGIGGQAEQPQLRHAWFFALDHRLITERRMRALLVITSST